MHAAVLALLFASTVTFAADKPVLMRQPTVSRTSIAFSYAGDLWITHFFFLVMVFTPLQFARAGVLETAKHPITNEYHGVKVADDYIWLENFDAPPVRQWTAAQNRNARAYLDGLPARAVLEQRLTSLYARTSANYSGLQSHGGILFALKFQPPLQQPMLIDQTTGRRPSRCKGRWRRHTCSSRRKSGCRPRRPARRLCRCLAPRRGRYGR